MQVIKDFKDIAGAPDIVSVSFNLWDLGHWAGTNPGDFSGHYIPDELMQLWLTQAEPIFKNLQVGL